LGRGKEEEARGGKEMYDLPDFELAMVVIVKQSGMILYR